MKTNRFIEARFINKNPVTLYDPYSTALCKKCSKNTAKYYVNITISESLNSSHGRIDYYCPECYQLFRLKE